MTDDLIQKLEAALSFDYAQSRIAYQKHEWPVNETISQHTYWTEGQAHEAARRAQVDQALVTCVHALRFRNMHDDDCADASEKFGCDEMCECGASFVNQALEQLAKALEGKA